MYVSSHMESSRLWIICLVNSTPWLVLRQCRAISVVVLAADIWLADDSWQWDFVSSVFFVCLNFATSPSSHSNMQLESRRTMCHTRDGVLCWGLWQSDAGNCKISSLTLHLQGWNHTRAGGRPASLQQSLLIYMTRTQELRLSSIFVSLNNTLAHLQKIYPLSCSPLLLSIHNSVSLISNICHPCFSTLGATCQVLDCV